MRTEELELSSQISTVPRAWEKRLQSDSRYTIKTVSWETVECPHKFIEIEY